MRDWEVNVKGGDRCGCALAPMIRKPPLQKTPRHGRAIACCRIFKKPNNRLPVLKKSTPDVLPDFQSTNSGRESARGKTSFKRFPPRTSLQPCSPPGCASFVAGQAKRCLEARRVVNATARPKTPLFNGPRRENRSAWTLSARPGLFKNRAGQARGSWRFRSVFLHTRGFANSAATPPARIFQQPSRPGSLCRNTPTAPRTPPAFPC